MERNKVSFTAKDVAALRQKTGLGMMDCKKALTEVGGDISAAEEWLREHLKGKMEKRTERATAEGRIGIHIDNAQAVMVEVQTETDFTAKNDLFLKAVEDITNHAFGLPAGPVSATDEITKRVDDLRISTGENVNFARGEKLEGGAFGHYLHHDGKRAAIVQIEGTADADLLKGICQHIVFHDPAGVSEDDIPAAELDKVRAEAIKEAKESGKPEQIAEKIAEGKVRKHLEQSVLLYQKYVHDESQQVKAILPAGVTIKRFVRYTLGM
ncbi:MAG: translation elongation factor Ts [Phycisphaerales bacterium]|nr:MAG: translation elongation factor Ts [Phycisphaerales bacterium]